jgi:hypothetical protein
MPMRICQIYPFPFLHGLVASASKRALANVMKDIAGAHHRPIYFYLTPYFHSGDKGFMKAADIFYLQERAIMPEDRTEGRKLYF